MEISWKLSLILVLSALLPNASPRKIGIWHYNDISGQLTKFKEGTHDTSLPPDEEGCTNDSIVDCIGGLSTIKNITAPDFDLDAADVTVRLTSGNFIGGENGWLSTIPDGWKEYGTLIHTHFNNLHAMTFGMKEFSAGLARTNDFRDKIGTNVDVLLCNVQSNCYFGDDNPLEKTFCANIIKDMKELDMYVGLVGFINPNADKLSSPGKLTFEDPITAIQRVVREADAKYKTFVAIGDGSLSMAQEIIANVPKVKLVIYGSGFSTTRNMTGDYPLKYEKNGNTGYIATAGRYGSSIGKLVMEVDDLGNFKSIKGELDTPKFEPKPPIEVINQWLADYIDPAKINPVGKTIFDIEGGETCWRKECNLGNLVADSMVHCAYNSSGVELPHNEPIIGLWMGGSLHKDHVKQGVISQLDIHKWLPYHNRAVLAKLTGSNLLRLLDTSAQGITANETNNRVSDWGQFLQVSSGVEVFYNTSGGRGKVGTVNILHIEGTSPTFKPVESNQIYTVVIPSFLSEGRSVYNYVTETGFFSSTSAGFAFDDDCVSKYIESMGTLTMGFEERIWIDEEQCKSETIIKEVIKEVPVTERVGGNTAVTVILTIVFTLIALGIVFVGYYYVIPKLTGRQPNGFRNFE